MTGTLTDGRTVALDEVLPVTSAKVRVVIEPVGTAPRAYRQVLAEIRDRQTRRGHRPPTREAVDIAIRAERDSWDR